MAGALMARAVRPLLHPLWPIDAGRGVALQRHGTLGLAARKSLLGGAKLGNNAPLLVAVPAPSGKDEAGARDEEEKDLRHRQNPKRDHSARASIAEMTSAASPPVRKPKSSAPLSARTLRLRRNHEVEGVTSLKRTSSP
jgi:hypothetical protein